MTSVFGTHFGTHFRDSFSGLIFGTHFRDSFPGLIFGTHFPGLIFGTHFRDSNFSGLNFFGTQIFRDSKFSGTQIFPGLKSSGAHILPKSNFSEIQNFLLSSRLLLGILVILRIILGDSDFLIFVVEDPYYSSNNSFKSF